MTTSNTTPTIRFAWMVLAASASLQAPRLLAQANSAPSAMTSSSEAPAPRDEILKLNPFEVQADSDKSYGALNSNSVTRFKVELDQLPVSADIFNQAFMNDVGSTSVEDMLLQYSSGSGAHRHAAPWLQHDGHPAGQPDALRAADQSGVHGPRHDQQF